MNLTAYALPVFALLMLTEAIVSGLRQQQAYQWRDFGGSMSQLAMNFGTALRQSPTGPLTRALFYWPLPLLGLHPLLITSAGAVATIYGFWTHTEQIKRIWAPLESIFVSPAHHRVHHGSNPEYIDKNYANVLIIWDRLFGTFQDEGDKVRYGLITNIETYNPLRIAFAEWIKLFHNMDGASSLSTAWQYWINPPDWKPGLPANIVVTSEE